MHSSADNLVQGGFACPAFHPRGVTGPFRPLVKSPYFTLVKPLIWPTLQLNYLPPPAPHLPHPCAGEATCQQRCTFSQDTDSRRLSSSTCPLKSLTSSSPLTFSSDCFSISLPCAHLRQRTSSFPGIATSLNFLRAISPQKKTQNTTSCRLSPYHNSSFFVFNPCPPKVMICELPGSELPNKLWF